MAHICCKTNSDACHTVASLEAAYGSVQQPADNPVAVQTCRSQSHFLSYMMSSECDATAHDIITTPTEARVILIPQVPHVLTSHCGASVIVTYSVCVTFPVACIRWVLDE